MKQSISHSNKTALVSYGFTLIELLVVVGIISLFMAILLPSISTAREFSRGLSCSNNIRQLMLANTMYSSDNHDTWPARGDNSATDYENTLKSWVPCGKAYDPQFTVTKGVLYPLVKDIRIYRCPSDQEPARGELSYSINANLYAPFLCLPSTALTIWYPKPDKFTQQSDRLIVFVDEGNPNDGNFKPIGTDIFWADSPKWYHNEKAAFGFFDGHVELRRSDDEQVNLHDSPFWFPDTERFLIVD